MLEKLMSDEFKGTWLLRTFGLFKVPLILFCNPKVLKIDSKSCEILIPLNYRTKNHLNSMYFGTLAVGADVAGGLLAMNHIRESKKNVSLVFKDFTANFLKRPDADVIFSCHQGEEIKSLIDEAVRLKERVNIPLKIQAHCPTMDNQMVAEFVLTLSLKLRES